LGGDAHFGGVRAQDFRENKLIWVKKGEGIPRGSKTMNTKWRGKIGGESVSVL